VGALGVACASTWPARHTVAIAMPALAESNQRIENVARVFITDSLKKQVKQFETACDATELIFSKYLEGPPSEPA
jgi:hypothetical protein